MADITLSRNWTFAAPAARRLWLDRLGRRATLLRRRARRDRYRAQTGRTPGHYPWVETLFASMGRP